MSETIDKTVMTEWAESSLEFSAAMKKLLDEFGFPTVADVKWPIKKVFPPKYLKVCGVIAKIKSDDFSPVWMFDPDILSAIDLAKAILCASAILETNDLRDIIRWANG